MNKTLFFVKLFSYDAFLRFLFFNRINIFSEKVTTVKIFKIKRKNNKYLLKNEL